MPEERLARQKVAGAYLYCSREPARRRIQILAREAGRPSEQQARRSSALDQSEAALILLFSLLDERQRRLFAGLESMLLGWSGDFHLHVNKKTICSSRSADRDRQLKSIRRARNRFERQGLPIISVDTKKREMIGLFKNPGATWAKAATPVNDHDFRKDAVGVAVSYGIYASQANRGHIVVGTSHCLPGTTPSLPHERCRFVLAAALTWVKVWEVPWIQKD